ncbi:MAG TPA: sigma-70 family RNA polymerase sigma factor [Bryobacteraceae bacterium]|nr:sigma-70 family RNA polymerase sigma factor [Bryobacteraceae bacterium]
MTLPPDDELVIAAQNGDREAFSRLYADFAPMVHGILLARVPRDEVDDLLQDVFLTAMRRLSSLRDPRAFGAWLATVTRNRANDYHRAPHGTKLPEQIPEPRPIENEAWFVLQAIRNLPDAYQDTLMLRLVEGMSGPEISARTGLTEGSVRVNLHRGMAMLREALAKKAV